MPRATSPEVLQGTLDLLVLRTLALEPMHGWGIATAIQQRSQEMLQINQGSLYPALHRLEERGWIRAHWGASETNRRARFYELTPLGEKQMTVETASWEGFVRAVTLVLQQA